MTNRRAFLTTLFGLVAGAFAAKTALSKRDDVPTNLPPGSFVINKSAVTAFGPNFSVKLNQQIRAMVQDELVRQSRVGGTYRQRFDRA